MGQAGGPKRHDGDAEAGPVQGLQIQGEGGGAEEVGGAGT